MLLVEVEDEDELGVQLEVELRVQLELEVENELHVVTGRAPATKQQNVGEFLGWPDLPNTPLEPNKPYRSYFRREPILVIVVLVLCLRLGSIRSLYTTVGH